MAAVRIARITDEPLDAAAHLAAVDDPRAGAVTSFIGTVRDHDPDAARPSSRWNTPRTRMPRRRCTTSR
jgi:molybdopterin synthase catalytic subunit